jgi:hypothetical protein
MPRSASLAFELLSWWIRIPPGVAVSMDEMMSEMAVRDEQQIRNALVKIRKGRVADPARAGSFLKRKPIRYHASDGKYYDFSRVTAAVVRGQIPGTVLARKFSELMTRVATLQSAIGSDGLARSVEDLLDDVATRELIAQLPFDRIWDVANLALQVAQARQLLELDRVKRAIADGADAQLAIDEGAILLGDGGAANGADPSVAGSMEDGTNGRS